MEAHELVRYLWQRRITVLVLALVGVLVGALLTVLTVPRFVAEAKMYVSFNSVASAGSSELVQGVNYAERAMASYVKVGKTSMVLDAVEAKLNNEVSASELNERLRISAVPDTTMINVEVLDEDPERAARTANVVSEVLRDTITEQLEQPVDSDSSRVQLAIVEPASVPARPTSPDPVRNVVLGGVLGLLLGVAVALLRGMFDKTIRSRSDLAEVTNLPLLGEIPDDPIAKDSPLMSGEEIQSLRGEPFRAVRTNLQFLGVGHRLRSLMVTSSVPGEGKSTVSVNLAAMLAEAGSRVLVVDTDLRRPKLAEYVGLDGSVGLTDVLIGRVPAENAIQRWGRHHMFVLPAGRIPPNPSELLGSREMHDLMSTLSTHFDFVIVDAPPTLLVTDPVVVSGLCDGVIVVAAAGLTKKPQLGGTLDTLLAVEAPIKGVVLTRVPTKGPDSYRYGAYTNGSYSSDHESTWEVLTHAHSRTHEAGRSGLFPRVDGGGKASE